MSIDIGWLTSEAHRIHDYFSNVFYLLVVTLVTIGVVVDYFKLPIGGVPSAGILVGRALVATLLLVSFTEVSNAFGSIADAVAMDLGNLSSLDGVLKNMGRKIDGLSPDWLNARTLIMTGLSILTYTFLFYSVIIAEIAHTFSWTLLYVFSPVLIVMFVLPSTSSATKALYRSLIEVCCWKIVWAVLAALLWASVLVEMQSSSGSDFIKLVCINLILGSSLIATPLLVHALSTAGITSLTKGFSGIMTPIGPLTPRRALNAAKQSLATSKSALRSGHNSMKKAAAISTHSVLFAMNPVKNTRGVVSEAGEKLAVRARKVKRLIAAKKVSDGAERSPKKASEARNEPLTTNQKNQGQNAATIKNSQPTSWQKYRSSKENKNQSKQLKDKK